MEKKFLDLLFKTLEENNAEYLVVRNYETLPESVPGTDIDIVVKSSQYESIIKKLEEGVRNIGYRRWKSYPKNFGLVQVSFTPKDCRDVQDVVRIDFILDNMMWLGFDLIKPDLLWKSREMFNNISVLSDPVKTALTFLNAFLFGGKVKQKYLSEYADMDLENRKNVDELLAGSFGVYGKVVVDSLHSGKVDSLNTTKLRYSFLKTRGANARDILLGLLSWFKTDLKRALSPPGLFVVLIGPDGSGKSTINEMIQTRCKRLFAGVDSFHLFPKPKVFYFIDKISGKRWNKRQATSSEWELRSRDFPAWKSIARGLYQLVRFWAGYWLWIYPRLVKGHLVIGERWNYDLLLDPASKGIDLPLWVRKIFFALCPRPHKTLSFCGSASKMAERKKELPVAEIERQIDKMKELLEGRKRVYFINSTEEKDKTFEDSLSALTEN